MAGEPGTEFCDGKDNDCDGAIDEGFDLGAPCSVGVGECQATGTLICSLDGSGTICSAVAGEPETEICDGKDNDCDGTVDNGCDTDSENPGEDAPPPSTGCGCAAQGGTTGSATTVLAALLGLALLGRRRASRDDQDASCGSGRH